MLIFFEKKNPFILCYTNMILTSLVNDGFLLTKLLFFFRHCIIIYWANFSFVLWRYSNWITLRLKFRQAKKHQNIFLRSLMNCHVARRWMSWCTDWLIVLNGFIWIMLSGFAVIAMSKTKIRTVHVLDQKLFYFLENSKWS